MFILPASLFAWKMESGTVNLSATTVGSSTWQTVTLQQTYDTTPLIFVLVDEGSGYNGDSPVSLRVQNRATTSFEIVQVEPQSSVGDVEGEHPAVNVHYIAIEAGDHTLVDGTHIIAGIHNTSTYLGKNASGASTTLDTVTFPTVFSSIPVILSGIQSMNNENSILPGTSSSPWIVTALKNNTTTSFEVALERAETSSGSVVTAEDIGYLAIESSVQSSIYDTSCNAISYETIRTSDSVTGWDNQCTSVNFVNTYTAVPNVIGTQETRDGGDGGWLRRCSLGTTAVGIAVDEDQAGDIDRAHTTEIAGLAVFEKDFIYDSTFNTIGCGLVVEYRMDECYWLNGSGGVIGDVKDTSSNAKDATSSGVASIIENTGNPPMCNYGNFTVQPDQIATEDGTVGNSSGGVSISIWLKPSAMTNWQAIVTKSKAYNWDDGWGLVHFSGDADNEIRFFVNNYNNDIKTELTLDQWNHVVATYDNQNLRIYVDGVESLPAVSYVASIDNSALIDPVRIAYDDPGDDEYIGGVDELKIWDKVLTSAEINDIFNNEKLGTNYDGTPRTCPTCETGITAGAWEFIGIPADFRTETNKDVADVFEEFVSGDYGNPSADNAWVIFKRIYSDTNNSSDFDIVPYTGEALEFGQGYWLRSRVAESWSENGLKSVDYNSTDPACPTTRCVEIDLKSVSLNFGPPDDDPNDGTGSNRNNMLGFPGKAPVEWADCRILVDGTAFTPTDANASGYIDKQIWQYNPGAGGADANGYTTCDDSLTTCKLEPYKGFWLVLSGKTKNKTVKLLIPQD